MSTKSDNPLIIKNCPTFTLCKGDKVHLTLSEEALTAYISTGQFDSYDVDKYVLHYLGDGTFDLYAYITGHEELDEFLAELEN